MVMVSVSETYDLHTEVNKMTVIGVHTPTKELIQKTYPGLCMNSKYFRIDHVDCVLSTAQTLPLGVNEIGLDNDKIRPQDMMNPILYKACSNDSWNTLEARLHGIYNQVNSGANNVRVDLNGSMAFVDDEHTTDLEDEHGVYYSLLSNRDGFRISHPRDGVTMKGLVPLVFERLYTFGEMNRNRNSADEALEEEAPAIAETTNGQTYSMGIVNVRARSMRGNAKRMPRMNTTYLTGLGNSPQGASVKVANGMGDGMPLNCQAEMPDIPPVMLGCIVLPPVSATTGILYYRMVCRAYIEFSEVRPIQDITSFAQMSSIYADLVYHTDYNEQSRAMDHLTDMVDIKNGSIEKVMEGM